MVRDTVEEVVRALVLFPYKQSYPQSRPGDIRQRCSRTQGSIRYWSRVVQHLRAVSNATFWSNLRYGHAPIPPTKINWSVLVHKSL